MRSSSQWSGWVPGTMNPHKVAFTLCRREFHFQLKASQREASISQGFLCKRTGHTTPTEHRGLSRSTSDPSDEWILTAKELLQKCVSYLNIPDYHYFGTRTLYLLYTLHKTYDKPVYGLLS